MLSFCAFFLSYNVGEELKIGIPLIIGIVGIILMDLFISKRFAWEGKFNLNTLSASQLFMMKLLSAFIVVVGVLDLWSHGLVMFNNPMDYSKFLPHEAWLRHFSSLCWILAPIGLLLPFPKPIKASLVIWAFIFPILVVDRNRFLMAFFSSAFTLYFMDLPSVWRKKINLLALSIACLAVIGFIVVGEKRVGKDGIHLQYIQRSEPVPLDKPCDLPARLPIKEGLEKKPAGFQWIFLYVTTPIYNLSVQMKCEIKDSSLLKAQLIPLWKRHNKVGAPYLVSMGQNAGTEFMPFFLAFGIMGIFLVLIGEYFLLRWSLHAFSIDGNIFNFLVLVKLSYCALLTGFAPQFFTWTNLGFIFVIKVAERISSLPLFNDLRLYLSKSR